MQLTPLRDRVVILPTPSDRTHSGRIIIPEVAREKQTAIGRVVQVGPGLLENGALVPMDAKVGDTVLFMKYSGVDLEIDGKTFAMVRDHEILAIYDPM